jgi:hypothetical protein
MATAKPPPAEEATTLISSRCAKLRRLGPMVEDAFRASMAHEGSPAHAELEARYQALEDEYETLAREIWASPAHTWHDIVERAELAYGYAHEDPAVSRLANDLGTQSAAELILAVLKMFGGEAWREPARMAGPERVGTERS